MQLLAGPLPEATESALRLLKLWEAHLCCGQVEGAACAGAQGHEEAPEGLLPRGLSRVQHALTGLGASQR